MLPFITGQVAMAKKFCGRREEINRLRTCLGFCNHVYIQGERRVGKSSPVVETVRRMRGWLLVHVDLLGVKSARDVGRRFATAVVSSAKDDNLAVKTLRAIASLRPAVDFDPQTGSPSIRFGTQGADFLRRIRRIGRFSSEFGQDPVQQSGKFLVADRRLGNAGHAPEIGASGLRLEQWADLVQVGCNARNAATVETMTTRTMQHVTFELGAKRLGVGRSRGRDADHDRKEKRRAVDGDRMKKSGHFSGWRSVACPTTTAIEQL